MRVLALLVSASILAAPASPARAAGPAEPLSDRQRAFVALLAHLHAAARACEGVRLNPGTVAAALATLRLDPRGEAERAAAAEEAPAARARFEGEGRARACRAALERYGPGGRTGPGFLVVESGEERA
jgi:hypothetical protein